MGVIEDGERQRGGLAWVVGVFASALGTAWGAGGVGGGTLQWAVQRFQAFTSACVTRTGMVQFKSSVLIFSVIHVLGRGLSLSPKAPIPSGNFQGRIFTGPGGRCAARLLKAALSYEPFIQL